MVIPSSQLTAIYKTLYFFKQENQMKSPNYLILSFIFIKLIFTIRKYGDHNQVVKSILVRTNNNRLSRLWDLLRSFEYSSPVQEPRRPSVGVSPWDSLRQELFWNFWHLRMRIFHRKFKVFFVQQSAAFQYNSKNKEPQSNVFDGHLCPRTILIN